MKSLWFHKMSPKSHKSTSVCWIYLKQIWGICFRDDNGNCVGRCLQAVFWNESLRFASTDKLVSKYSGAYPKLSKLTSQHADACSVSAQWFKQWTFCFSSLTNSSPQMIVLSVLWNLLRVCLILRFQYSV